MPALIGFRPRESLVLVATGGETGRRIGLTLRMDLPPARHREPVAAEAVRGILLDHPAGAAVIVVSRRGWSAARPPHAALADLVADRLTRNGVEPHTVVWAERISAGARWACYGPCRCSGTLPDPGSTVFAAAVVAEGRVIQPDRTALERLVAPGEPGLLRRRERLLVQRLERAAARGSADDLADPVAGLARVDAAIAAAGAGLALDDRTAVELAFALGDVRVRDEALLRNTGPSAAAAERLWTLLVSGLPDPEAAEPAALLAVSALLRGDGALANVALERAERAWPGHRLTGLLTRVAGYGLRPAQVRQWLLAPPAQDAG